MAYRFGEFRLDATILEHRGQLVPLAPKAVDTLYLLVSQAPAVVSREEILAAVWPGTFVVESSLARNISVIRKALEECGGPGEYIETIPKRGYRFVAAAAADGNAPAPASAATAKPVAEPVPPIPETPQPPAQHPHPPNRRLPWLLAALVLVTAGAAWLLRPKAPAPPDAADRIGRHLLYKATPIEARSAVEWYSQAVAENPRSASAHAGLADALIVEARLAGGDGTGLTRAKAAAETAVQLDARMAIAQSALGAARMLVDRDFAAAEQCFRRALELDPASLAARMYYAQLLRATRRFDEALAVIREAVRLDPVTPVLGVQVGMVYYCQMRLAEAEREFRTVLQRERNYTLAHYYLALTLGFLGRFEEAAAHLAQAELHPGVLRTDRAWLALRQGDRAPAEAAYADLQRLVRQGDVPPVSILLLAANLGRLDDAFQAIAADASRSAVELSELQTDPRLDALRRDERFARLRLSQPRGQ